MLNTKLVLIEGLPGAGKSTTTQRIGKTLEAAEFACHWFREEDEPHPIPCLDFAIKDLQQNMMPLWTDFVDRAIQAPTVTILDSRLWQNTALYMYMSEISVEEIAQYHGEVCNVLTPLSPALIYLDQDDAEAALRRLYTIRGEEWMEETLEETTQYAWFRSRNINDFSGWVKFFEEWTEVAHGLYNDWPHTKIRILNSHENWSKAYARMDQFLGLDQTQSSRDQPEA
jgi:deoxyadenosine/deoxycytidine kinase